MDTTQPTVCMQDITHTVAIVSLMIDTSLAYTEKNWTYEPRKVNFLVVVGGQQGTGEKKIQCLERGREDVHFESQSSDQPNTQMWSSPAKLPGKVDQNKMSQIEHITCLPNFFSFCLPIKFTLLNISLSKAPKSNL